MTERGTRAEMRRSRRVRTRSVALAVAAALMVIGAGIGIVALSGGDSGTSGRAAPRARAETDAPVASLPTSSAPAAVPATVPVAASTFRAASTKGGDIPVFGVPDDRADPTVTLSPITEYLQPRTLLAFEDHQDWLRVYLPTRPNNSTGWVRAADVDVSAPLEWKIRVSLADRSLVLLHNDVVDFETGVAIGTEQYPTPTGTFYITDPVDLHDTPNLGYGVFALGLSGHSDVLTEFLGGDGQIAIHGTNNPGDIGLAVSHGCVRVTNDAIERLSTLPLGTPVEIV
jgi:lipoprotein-anchoring transpeptidase ErfK/SrfK